MKTKQKLQAPVAKALVRILDYLWSDEQRDFLQSSPESQANHLFLDLRTLRTWLDKQCR